MAITQKKKPRRGNRCGSLIKRAKGGAYIARWTAYDGKRRERSTNTTDRAVAERILAEYVNDEALRRRGLLDPKAERYVAEGGKKLVDHIDDYLRSRERSGLATKSLRAKRSRLTQLVHEAEIARLADLTSNNVERHLYSLRQAGRSARTINSWLEIISAFANWCVAQGRLPSNPITSVSRLNQESDRRRCRRPLTDEEFGRLLAVAEQYRRSAWYLGAALAGLRRGDLERLEWRDVDFEAGTLTIRKGKSGRVDMVPLHPQLAQELKRCRGTAQPMERVFPRAVTNHTRQRDFLRAGLAREEVVRDANGKVVMITTPGGKSTRPKTRIVTTDNEGREVDLHALRTTLGTRLARAGVAPQVAQRIMRHSDYKTTLTHYTVLGLGDTSAAIEQIPTIPPTQTAGPPVSGLSDPHQRPHLPAREMAPKRANPRDALPSERHSATTRKPRKTLGKCDVLRRDAKQNEKPAIGLEPMTCGLQNRCSTN